MALKFYTPEREESNTMYEDWKSLTATVDHWHRLIFNSSAIEELGVKENPWVKFAVDDESGELYIMPCKKDDPNGILVPERDYQYYVMADKVLGGLGVEFIPGETKFKITPEDKLDNTPIYRMKRVEK